MSKSGGTEQSTLRYNINYYTYTQSHILKKEVYCNDYIESFVTPGKEIPNSIVTKTPEVLL